MASHLAPAIQNAGLTILEVYSPNFKNAHLLAQTLNCKALKFLSELDCDTDLLILAIPDMHIDKLMDNLPPINGIVAHTSGFSSIDVLSSAANYGVFYPLQTFTKGRVISMTDIPFCIEGNNQETETLLIDLARELSNNVQLVNSEDRKHLHLAAVMVNNFTNHIYHIADDFLKENGINFRMLLPLIQETASKIHFISPEEAQTGPAKRNDMATIKEHEQLLNANPEYKKLYQLLSEQIRKKYNG